MDDDGLSEKQRDKKTSTSGSHARKPASHTLFKSKLTGGKILCEDIVNTPECVVYSLGSNADFSFEVDVLRRTTCQVNIKRMTTQCKDLRVLYKPPFFHLPFVSNFWSLYLRQVVTFDCTTNPATVHEKRHKFMPKCIGSEKKMKVSG